MNAARLDRFRKVFAGDVVLPGDSTYDDARRVWNAMIDRRPAAIVRPTNAEDVSAAIRFGRDEQLPIAVRSGGHSMPGYGTCDDGLVIDLSRMRGVTVDPEHRVARVNGGALLGELDAAAQAYGLVCPVGVVSHTGVGGLTLGGGMGRLQRRFGFTIDNLRSVELVTAEGRLVTASENENADLFWALRGAGANFGVVTLFEFSLHPFDGVVTHLTADHPASRVGEAWAFFRDVALSAPDHIGLAFAVGKAAEDNAGGIPAGDPVVTLAAYHSGDPARAEADLASLREFGPPVATKVIVRSYLDYQQLYDDELGWGHRVYTKGGFTDDIPGSAWDAIANHVADGSGAGGFGLWAQGGAIGRLSEDATAFTGRSAPFQMSTECGWDDPSADDDVIAWARALYAIAEPYSRTGRYVNDVSDTAGDLGRWIYGDEKYDRLVAVKRAWDPDNVFHLNQNIRP